MSIIRNVLILCVILSGSVATASSTPCQLEHGYQVCHATSTTGKQVTLSFAPVRVITAETREAFVCAANGSGFAMAQASFTAVAGSQVTVQTNDQGNGCADLKDLNLNRPGNWTLTINFRDGDRAVFSVNVQPTAEP